jgi:tetratricopeptide (TPR) repeat protein
MDEVTKLITAKDSYQRVKSLTNQTALEVGLLEEAHQIANSIVDDEFRASALALIVRAYVAIDQMEQAKRITLIIPTVYEKTEALLSIAQRLLEVKRPKEALNILIEAKDLARSIEVPPDKAHTLARIAELLNRAGMLEEAHKTWDEAIDAAQKGEADPNGQYTLDSSGVALQIAEAIALAGDRQKARHVALAIRNKLRRAQALASLDSLETD